MRTTDLDAVAPLYPVGKTAAKVAGRGEHFESKKLAKKSHHVRAHAPLPTYPIPSNPNFIDMTGRTIGRLTVIGYGGQNQGRSRWVVRCVCGTYEHRRGKTLRDTEYAKRAACSECDHVDQMRQQYSSVKRRA